MTIFVWHCHHDTIVEPILFSIEDRVQYIKKQKSKKEQELRLKLFKKVQGTLPPGILVAGEAWCEAEKAYEEAKRTYDESRKTYNTARKAYYATKEVYFRKEEAYYKAEITYRIALEKNKKAILALHAKECPDCPWDGETIFP